jgi:hypothetical protein
VCEMNWLDPEPSSEVSDYEANLRSCTILKGVRAFTEDTTSQEVICSFVWNLTL